MQSITDIEERIAYSDSVINSLEDHLELQANEVSICFLEQVKKNLDATASSWPGLTRI